MNRYRIIYTPSANDDLQSIYAYIAYTLKEKSIAKKQINRIRKAIRALDTSPERYVCVTWEPWHSMNTRQFSVGNYVIYYLVEHETHTVTVNRIFYGGRDVEHIINAE